MIEYTTKLKKWGNSMGVVVSKEQAAKEHLKPEQEIKVIITPKKMFKVKDILGTVKGWRKSTEEIMKETDKELDSKFLRESA